MFKMRERVTIYHGRHDKLGYLLVMGVPDNQDRIVGWINRERTFGEVQRRRAVGRSRKPEGSHVFEVVDRQQGLRGRVGLSVRSSGEGEQDDGKGSLLHASVALVSTRKRPGIQFWMFDFGHALTEYEQGGLGLAMVESHGVGAARFLRG